MDNRRRQRTFARIALATAIALTECLAASIRAPAHAAQAEASRDQGAEQFVQVQGQRLVSILADKSQSMADRIRAFRAAVNEIADVPRITRFVLGKYARTIAPAQMQRFAPVFQDYAQDVYQQRLENFHAETLTVTGSLVRKPGDVVVRTTITGGDVKQPTPVSWRVLGSGSNWKVVDVEVSGVWLAITQQDDFVSTIDNHGGSIDALISRLEEVTQGQAAAAAADH
jgi:phospholipid transport system substrate-binding protein